MHAFVFLMAGIASWFQPAPMYGDQLVCASNTIPISTKIFIVNDDNGDDSSCTVIGTGPFYGGRILDVSPSVARALGFIRAGTAHVRISKEVSVCERSSKTLPTRSRCIGSRTGRPLSVFSWPLVGSPLVRMELRPFNPMAYQLGLFNGLPLQQ
jgi:hypothetical protein